MNNHEKEEYLKHRLVILKNNLEIIEVSVKSAINILENLHEFDDLIGCLREYKETQVKIL